MIQLIALTYVLVSLGVFRASNREVGFFNAILISAFWLPLRLIQWGEEMA